MRFKVQNNIIYEEKMIGIVFIALKREMY
jgi:hypothetical protein